MKYNKEKTDYLLLSISPRIKILKTSVYVFLCLSEENAYPFRTEMAEQLIMWAFKMEACF